MSQLVKYVGLDVHKDTIAVAVAEDDKRSEVREHGTIANTPAAMTKLLGKLGGPGIELHICYEAGPCGYGIQRQVAAAGHSCAVVAPSLIPRRPGDRIKTDRRDAVKLARLHRAGELTSVWVPDRLTKRSATWSELGWPRCAVCDMLVSNCLAFCSGTATIIIAPHGPRCIGVGCPGCASHRTRIISCWRTVSRRSTPQRSGVTA
ncbi:hypothetical protein GCM10009087_24720 [Sphingomonas oligophenolica]